MSRRKCRNHPPRHFFGFSCNKFKRFVRSVLALLFHLRADRGVTLWGRWPMKDEKWRKNCMKIWRCRNNQKHSCIPNYKHKLQELQIAFEGNDMEWIDILSCGSEPTQEGVVVWATGWLLYGFWYIYIYIQAFRLCTLVGRPLNLCVAFKP